MKRQIVAFVLICAASGTLAAWVRFDHKRRDIIGIHSNDQVIRFSSGHSGEQMVIDVTGLQGEHEADPESMMTRKPRTS